MKFLNLIFKTFTIFFLCSIATPIFAKKILQQQELPFEVCLKVIETTSEKISVEPVVMINENDVRVVRYNLADGTMTIVCDRIQGELIVTTP